MAIIPFHIVDAFADHPFTGNPAAIVPNASGLTETEMMQITEELSMEAGFVLPPEDPEADIRLRFFTQRREAILSGHVALAAFSSMADRGFFRPLPEGLELKLECGAGLLPVTLTAVPDGQTLVTLELPTPRFGEPIPAGEVAAALGIPAEVLRLGDHGPHRVSGGFDQIVVPVNDRQIMRGVFRNMEAVGELTDRRGVGGLTLICPESHDKDADFHCRFFYPRVGVDEDIASGTSLGAAAAYAADRRLVPRADRIPIITEQGHALGRPTTAELTVTTSGLRILGVELSATGVVVMRGSFHFNRQTALAMG
jgi:trans-2,3-dihydro-3-hydroxyanthranilate isomerase